MSVPLGSERSKVTVEILYPQIFVGINTLKPQGQIKYKSKLGSEEWKTVVFSSQYHENRTHGLLIHFFIDPDLSKPEEFLPQTSRDF